LKRPSAGPRHLAQMRTWLSRQPVLAAVVLLAACSGSSFSPPPESAAADVVLRAYLQALVRGDCSAGKVLGTSTFGFGNGELCGQTTVSSFTIDGPPVAPIATEVVFATTLVTSGTADGSVRPGTLTWFYDLKRSRTAPSGSRAGVRVPDRRVSVR
jgi:hypothetical protein